MPWVLKVSCVLFDLVADFCQTKNLIHQFDLHFLSPYAAQVRSICDHCRPDKQTLMFSATFKKRIEKLARDVLNDPIKIIQGELGEANQDVSQRVLVFPVGTAKWEWLTSKLAEFTSAGSVLIFVTQKANADELGNNLKARDYEALIIHGDFDQSSRNSVITKFKKKEANILIATDVAARGLDIPHIRTVINFDVARDIDTHTHRVGRTGRAGVEGVAYTLVTEKDKEFAGHLVRNLEGADQEVPEELMKLALQSQWFKKARFKDSQAKKLNVKAGLGYKVGSGTSTGNSSSGSFSGCSSSSSSNPHHSQTSSYSSQSSSTPKSRFEAMKAAYSQQFKSAFRPASDTSSPLDNFSTPANNGSQPNPGNNAGHSSNREAGRSNYEFEKSKKKSRWQ